LIRYIFFDFDGTLVHSNNLKREGFFYLGKITSVSNVVISQIIAHGGDRHDIIKRISSYSGVPYIELLALYDRFLMKGFESVEKRSGADNLFALAVKMDIGLFILSATPQCYIEGVVRKFFPDVDFVAVVGGMDKGLFIKSFLIRDGVNSMDVLMVGDGQDDYEAARFAGCQFVGIEGGTWRFEKELGYPKLNGLSPINSLICKENNYEDRSFYKV